MYHIQFGNAAHRLFKKLPQDTQDKLKLEMHRLEQTPYSGAPLQGRFRNLRSLHLAYKGVAYRIIYRVYPEQAVVLIIIADKRENIYKRLEEMGV